jgi:predicted  nucleic acid-binding Zn-ribbon protein
MKNENQALMQRWKQQREEFLKLSVDFATIQAKAERYQKKNANLKGRVILMEPQVKELTIQVEQKDQLMAYLTEKHQEEVRDVKARIEYLEGERLKLESQLDEIHSELANSHALNRILEEKFDQVKTNSSSESDMVTETHRKLQQNLKMAMDELSRLRTRLEDCIFVQYIVRLYWRFNRNDRR